MIGYNGGSISNTLIALAQERRWLYITDTVERAIRYANAQATGVVSLNCPVLAEGGIVLEVECADVNFITRVSPVSLDECEAVIDEYRIVGATVRFCAYDNTIYGRAGQRLNRKQVIEFLGARGIAVREI